MKAGIDEAGRGPVVGPLVVGLVAAESDADLLRIGVRDSKALSAVRRRQLAAEIGTHAEHVVIVQVTAAEIDRLRAQQTLNEIEIDLFVELGRRVPADVFYLDACDTDAARFGRDFSQALARAPPPRVVSEHKADANYPLVSAASIIAKVRRDEEIAHIAARLEPKVGLPLGSGYSHDAQTRAFLERYLELFGRLPVEARSSWGTSRDLNSARQQRKLPGF